MKVARFFVFVAAVLVFAGLGRAQDKVDYGKMIVGKWQVTKADPGTAPEGTVIEFTKDGKMKITGKKGDESLELEGTYKVKANTFTFTLSVGGEEKSKTITITKMTKTSMTTKDEENKVVELTRQKAPGKKKKDKK